MTNLLENPIFSARYEELKGVSLNPRRHTALNAHDHSEQVSAQARALAHQNGCSEAEIALLENLGRAHDIGKVTGTARPEKSLTVLSECGPLSETFLALVKWHDMSLPWWNSCQRGQAPSDKAWARLSREVEIRLLCMFMVADRVDAPAGWRRNAPTLWFVEEARRRGLVGPLELDLPGHPSEICAGAALTRGKTEPEVLLIRVRQDQYELPKGGIEWDELPREAALRELVEEGGALGPGPAMELLGDLEYRIASPGQYEGTHLKRVNYFRVAGHRALGAKPERTHERVWCNREQAEAIPLVNEGLRPILMAALSREAS